MTNPFDPPRLFKTEFGIGEFLGVSFVLWMHVDVQR